MNEPSTETTPLAALARIRQMTDAWEQRLPETIRTETAVEVIRGVLATVVVPVSSPPADQTADLVKHVTRSIFALKTPSPDGSKHYQSGWDDGLEAAIDAARDALVAVLPATTEHEALWNELHRRDAETDQPHAADTSALRDRIAAAIVDLYNAGAVYALEPGQAELMADAVMAVLPTTNHDTDTSAELASLAVNAGRALQDEKRHYEIACRENTRLRAMVDEYGDGAGDLTRKLKQVRDLHRETCPLVKGEVPSGFKCGMCELLDAPAAPLRRVADETAATETEVQR